MSSNSRPPGTNQPRLPVKVIAMKHSGHVDIVRKNIKNHLRYFDRNEKENKEKIAALIIQSESYLNVLCVVLCILEKGSEHFHTGFVWDNRGTVLTQNLNQIPS